MALHYQLRRDRTRCLGGAGDFRDTLRMLSSFVDQLTGAACTRTLDLSASYDLLVSLIVFCNIRASDFVSERSFSATSHDSTLENFRLLGVEMLKYAQRFCDGPRVRL